MHKPSLTLQHTVKLIPQTNLHSHEHTVQLRNPLKHLRNEGEDWNPFCAEEREHNENVLRPRTATHQHKGDQHAQKRQPGTPKPRL